MFGNINMSVIDANRVCVLNVDNIFDYLRTTDKFKDNGEVEIKHDGKFCIYTKNELPEYATMEWELYKYNSIKMDISSDYTILLYPPNTTNLIGGELTTGILFDNLV